MLSCFVYTDAQCKEKLKKQVEKYCQGRQLTNYEIKNKTFYLKLVLKKNTTYGIYLFRAENSDMPVIEMYNKNDFDIQSFKQNNSSELYTYYKFSVMKSGIYKFNVGFKDDLSGCGVLAIYEQGEGKNTTIVIDERKGK
jgi:hypothetical protein